MVSSKRGFGPPGRSLILRYGLAALALAAAFYSSILTTAAILVSRNTRQSVVVAARLVPYNSAYLVRLAGWDPAQRTALLKRAVALNPFEVQAWFRLGYDAELVQHNVAFAEHCYLQAAAVNHMSVPKWTLANFYFRQGRESEFLKWAKATLEISPYSGDPVFAEMWLLDPNPEHLALSVPDRPSALYQYAWFLNKARQFATMPAIVQRLVRAAGNENPERFGVTDILGPIEDGLLAAGYPDAALQVWRTLSSAGWVKLPVPSPTKPLTNADFQVPFWNHGFDWVAIGNSGVAITRDPVAKALLLEFSGDEPEHCVLLQQWIPLQAGHSYNLRWSADAEGSDKPLGFTWHIRPVEAVDFASLDLLATPKATWKFSAPQSAGMQILSLEYARPLGERRAKGVLRISHLSLLPDAEARL